MAWKKSSLIWNFFPWFWLKNPCFSLISLTGKSLQKFPWIPWFRWSVGTLPGGCILADPAPVDGYCHRLYASHWNAFLFYLSRVSVNVNPSLHYLHFTKRKLGDVTEMPNTISVLSHFSANFFDNKTGGPTTGNHLYPETYQRNINMSLMKSTLTAFTLHFNWDLLSLIVLVHDPVPLSVYFIKFSSNINCTQKHFHKPDSGCTSDSLVITIQWRIQDFPDRPPPRSANAMMLSSPRRALFYPSVSCSLCVRTQPAHSWISWPWRQTRRVWEQQGDWSVFCALSSDDHWKPRSVSLSSCPVTTDGAELHTFPQHKPFILSNKCNLLNSNNWYSSSSITLTVTNSETENCNRVDTIDIHNKTAFQ